MGAYSFVVLVLSMLMLIRAGILAHDIWLVPAKKNENAVDPLFATEHECFSNRVSPFIPEVQHPMFPDWTFEELKHGPTCVICKTQKKEAERIEESVSMDLLFGSSLTPKTISKPKKVKSLPIGHTKCRTCGMRWSNHDRTELEYCLEEELEEEYEQSEPGKKGDGYKTESNVCFIYRVDQDKNTIVRYGHTMQDLHRTLTIKPIGGMPVIDTETVRKIVSVTNKHNKGTLDVDIGRAWADILHDDQSPLPLGITNKASEPRTVSKAPTQIPQPPTGVPVKELTAGEFSAGLDTHRPV
jgi:hypothetical protein